MTKLERNTGTKAKAIVIYARVSKAGDRKAVTKTLASDISLDAQIDAGRRYAANHDLEVIAELKEVESGRKANRPEFQKAVKLCKKHKAVLHVWSLSRAMRSTSMALEVSSQLSSAGCDLVSTTDQVDTTTAIGKCFFTILASINQLEAEIAGERIINSLNVKRTRNEWLGGNAPYGYDIDNGKLVPIKKEIKVLELMIKESNAGKSNRAIAILLNAKGIPTKAGTGKWWSKTVSNILKRHAKHQELN